MGGGNVLLVLFMGIAGGFVWLLKGAVEIIGLLFMRQGEFMADLHTTVFETDGKPTNFKRSLAKIALLNIAEVEFEKGIFTGRVLAVREGKLPVSRLFEKPHMDMFYEWMNKVHFSVSDEMIEAISRSKGGSAGNLGSTHPLVGDRIRNLEVLMNRHPIADGQSLTPANDATNAKELIQEVYDDAVTSLYGHKSHDDLLHTPEGISTHHQCSKCRKTITLTGKDSFFDTLENGQIICQDCLDRKT